LHNYSFIANSNVRFVNSPPLIINRITNAVLKYRNINKTIVHTMQPLQRTKDYANEIDSNQNVILFVLMLIGISLIPTSAIVFIIKERELNCKHQQIVSGVSLTS